MSTRSFPAVPPFASARTARSTLTDRHRLLLRTIRESGPISRSQLMKRVGLSGVAVFRGTEELAGEGLIAIGETVAEGRGQPSAIVRIRPEAAATIGLSIMTDHAEAVLVDLSGVVRARRDVSAAGMNRSAILDAVAGFAADACAEAGIATAALRGIGIAVAGFFVAPSTVNPAAELDDWAMVDLAAIVGDRLGLPVMVENIGNAAALGEGLLGVGAGHDSFVYLNVAAGFGGGIVRHRDLVRGTSGNAGELAGLFDLTDRPVPNLTSLRAVLADHGVATDGITDLVARYDDDWPGVTAWVDRHAVSFSYLAAALRFVLDPGAIVIGGRIPRPLAARIAARMTWPEDAVPQRRGQGLVAPPVLVAKLPAEAAATIGAATLLLERDYFS